MADAVSQTTPPNVRISAPRAWVTPRIAELPKLTALTLASAIGGGGGTSGGGSTVFGFLLAVGMTLLLGACSGDRTMQEPGVAVAPVGSQLVSCTVRRDTASMTCSSPSAAPGAATIGGQGVSIALRSSGVSYDGGLDILSATVTVQNLSVQPIGTQDGTTLSSGVNVFYVQTPIGPLGETVNIDPDGFGTFTAPGQPYYNYGEVLVSQATSTGKVWEFFMNGVASFTFTVLVSADMQSPGAFLNWAQEPIVGLQQWKIMTGWGSSGLALFGSNGLVYINEGNGWKARKDPLGTDISPYKPSVGVVNGPKEIFRVGHDGDYIRYYDGITWRTITGLPGGPVNFNFGLASTTPGKLYVGSDSVWLFTVNGSVTGGGTWSTLTDPTGTGEQCRAISSTNGRIYCGFGGGEVYSWDGASWAFAGNSGVNSPSVITATDTTDIWVTGSNLLKHYSGGGVWSAPATPGSLVDWTLNSASSAPDGTAYFVGNRNSPYAAAIWRWDGSAIAYDTLTSGLAPLSVWARDADTVYAAGTSGILWRREAGFWNPLSGDFGPANGSFWTSVYVASTNNIFLGTNGKRVRHWDGQNWVAQQTSTINNIGSLWGTGPTNVYAAGGDYTLEHYDGTSWSAVPGLPGGFGSHAVSGSGASDVWAVGFDGTGGFGANIARYNGSSWSGVASPDVNATLRAVWAFDPSFAIAVGYGGVAYRWNGTSWTADASGTGDDLIAVWGSSTSDAWAVGGNGAIRHWNGTSWGSGGSSCSGGQLLTGIWGRSATEIYVSSEGGQVCFYNGTSWSSIPGVGGSPLYGIGASPNGSMLMAVGGQVFRATR